MGAKEENLNQYSEYNKTLRAWLVGFGFGVPALFILNQGAQDKLLKSSDAECIIWLFLTGAAAQIFMALLNKIISWCAYYKLDKGEKNANKVVIFFSGLESWFIIDVCLDVISLAAFGWSIYLIVNLYGA